MSIPALRVAAALAFAGVLPGRASAQARTPSATAPAPATRPAAPTATSASAAAPAVRDLPLTAAERQAYVGTYRGTLPQGETGLVQVYLQGDTLRLLPWNQDVAPRLLHQGGHVFHPEGMPDFVVAQGRATGFSVPKEDGVLRATRVP